VLPLRLREPRGLALLAACLLASSGLELAIIHYAFKAPGLEDTYVIWKLGLWTFFLPALVVLVLTFSWLHLTRSFLVAPKLPRKPKARARARKAKRRKAKRFLDLSSLVRRTDVFGLAALRGLGVILLGFSMAVLFAMLTFYWPEAYALSGYLLKAFPPFSWLITGLSKLVDKIMAIEKLGEAIDWLKSASMRMNEALTPLAEGLGRADPIYKYAFIQNLVAWASGLSALLYRRPPVVRRKR